MNDKKKGIGLSYAWNGLKYIITNEKNFKIHLLATFTVIFVGMILKLNYVEWILIFLVIAIILVTEIINTVIETLIDYIKPEIHPTAKLIKDMMAGSVLIAAIIAIVIGLIIFIPKLMPIFS